MSIGVEMGRGVATRGIVATAHMSTGLAHPEMNPVVAACRQAVLAAGGIGGAVGDLVEMGARIGHIGTLAAAPQ